MELIAAIVMALAGLLGGSTVDDCTEDEFLAVTDAGVLCVHVEGDGYRWIR